MNDVILENKNNIPDKILIMCLADPSKNPRPNRIIKLFVKNGYKVDVLSYKMSNDLPVNNTFVIKGVKRGFLNKVYRLLLKTYRNWVQNIEKKVRLTEKMLNLSELDIIPNNYSLIFVENIELLPKAIRNKCKAKVICDLREFYPKEFENNILFKIFESNFKFMLCKNYLEKCDSLITVSDGLAEGYEQFFNVNTTIIRSLPYYVDLTPSYPDKREIRMVHHGAANKDRKLENMIYMFKYLDERFFLDFYLVGDNKYIKQLKKMSSFCNRIRFLDPISYEKIIISLNKYDIGLYLLEPTNYNTKHALPNKFFEFIQARLMLAIGPSEEMKKLVEQYNIGIISNSFAPEDLANRLNNLTYDDIFLYKKNSDIAAKELCYEKESEKLLNLIQKLIGDI